MTDVDLGSALQQALFDKLSAGVISAKGGTNLKQDTQLPYWLIAEDVVIDIGGKGSPFEEHTQTIAVMVPPSSKLLLRRVQEEVRTTIDGADLTAPGCEFSSPQWLSTEDAMTDDGSAIVGQQKFLIYAQPAR